jgi:hypothetical protein
MTVDEFNHFCDAAVAAHMPDFEPYASMPRVRLMQLYGGGPQRRSWVSIPIRRHRRARAAPGTATGPGPSGTALPRDPGRPGAHQPCRPTKHHRTRSAFEGML